MNMPLRTRRAVLSERAAVESALASVVGADEAARLIEASESMPPPPPPNDGLDTPGLRALRLMETRKGRAELARLTWGTV